MLSSMKLLYGTPTVNKQKKDANLEHYTRTYMHLGMAEDRLKQVTVPDESLVCPIQQGLLQTGVAISRKTIW
jgi:hypothetical protein